MKINEKISYYREQNNLNKTQLAKKLNVSPAYITMLENGKKRPSNELILKLSSIFNISPIDIDKSFPIGNFKSLNNKKDIIDLLEDKLGDNAKIISASELYEKLFKVFKDSFKETANSLIIKSTNNQNSLNNIKLDLDENTLNKLTNKFFEDSLKQNLFIFKFDSKTGNFYIDFKNFN